MCNKTVKFNIIKLNQVGSATRRIRLLIDTRNIDAPDF